MPLDGNRWGKMVGHRGCIYPCSGKPVLKTKPGRVWVAAHELPEYLQCSQCGYAPLPEIQPELIARYKKFMKACRAKKRADSARAEADPKENKGS